MSARDKKPSRSHGARKPEIRSAHPVMTVRSIPWSRWLFPVMIFVLSFLIFSPALQNEFVNWDDDKMLLENNAFRGLDGTHLRWMFTTFHMGPYQPLSWLTYSLDYQVWGMDPFGYHLTNLLLHAINAVLLYFLARRLLILTHGAPDDNRSQLGLALAAALCAWFFAIHPLRVESVAWATERRDVLSGVFFLACLLCYVHAASFDREPRRRLKWLAAVFGFYVLSLLSKAAGLTLPIVLFLLDVYPLKRLEAVKGRWFSAAARPIWLEKIPFLVVALVFGLVALIGQSESGALNDLRSHPPLARVAQAFYGAAFYLWKTVLPIQLSPLYEMAPALNPFSWPFLLSAALVVVVSLVALIVRAQWPVVPVAWISYIVLIAPMLGVAQSGEQLVADRYSYLPCLAWALIVGGAFHWVWRLASVSRVQISNPAAVGISACATLLLTVLCLLTWRQVKVWHDSETLWRHALVTAPSGIPHYNLGVVLAGVGKLEEAESHFLKAIEYLPDYRQAHSNLARLFENRGEFDAAIKHLRAVVTLDPTNAATFGTLGLVQAKQGRLEDALLSLQQAALLKPGDSPIRFNLGNLLVRLGRLTDAVQQYRMATEINPEFAEAFHNLGRVHAAQGQIDQAVKYFRTAVQLRPDYLAARASLSQALAEQKKAP